MSHDSFAKIEAELDKKLESLSIWELPFQTIMSWLFYTIEDIDRKGRDIVAADYASRIAYLYDAVRKKAAVAEATSTPLAITSFNFENFAADLNYLNAYAHYSMLMPQFHRGTFKVTEEGDKRFTIAFTDPNFEKAETLDRLYSYMSIQFATTYPEITRLRQLLIAKARNHDNSVEDREAAIIQHMMLFYKQTSLNIRVLDDDTLVNELGFTYDQYLSFCAAVRAYTDFSMEFGRAYHSLIAGAGEADAETFAAEHMEFTICCLNKVVLEHLMAFSGLTQPVFRKIFEYYLTKYSDSTNEKYQEKGHSGDGYFPPFIWLDDNLLFSSVGTKYLLPFNNLLYSLNKKSVKQFSEKISPHLEPALIRQMEYVFGKMPNALIQKNINYEGGEIDLVVLDQVQNTALCFQVKATVAPDSARTVQRVETRAMEGMDQLARFDAFPQDQKDAIINKAFNTNLSGISLQHILMVRSCAGSADAWQLNRKYPILNYAVFANLFARKIEKKDFTIGDFSARIYEIQEEILHRSKSVIVNETLKIGEYEIQFPNVDSDMHFILKMHTKTLKELPDFENIPDSK